ncbi:toll/interleukin-1 receptor domain-containing protein [Paracoccus methylarcula]|uniref:Toll/interleukin-1 receptor domain-containing protein n=1 Tax=Paracoccus methylarcula TaxID=72022 RepID=A0A3R7P2H6_9RHOB|nr:toll/interleukin-1 receptor domain-containing protein [Paracoccus methylarcula]RNF32969.1 toll/interleukin-1 receptor domain-containing protein [Paracoccus methylarcula]
MNHDSSGTIFLSHAAADKGFVEKVYERLDVSSTFYDIKSVQPGQSFIEAMQEGTSGKNIFVLFHSPNTQATWVEHEKRLAEVNHASKGGKVLVVPLLGETYRSLPEWMKGFMTCTENYSVSDIVRQIQLLQTQLIDELSGHSEIVVGREELLRKAHIETLKSVQQTGSPIQHIVISGLAGMGRKTFAQEYAKKSFSQMRSGGPIFNLPDMAEAVDFYLAMKQDISGVFTKKELEEQIATFEAMDYSNQAQMVLDVARHWADINQPIFANTKLGLRDRYRNLKPWLNEFFKLSRDVPSLRIIYISERRLPEEASIETTNLAQFQIEELSALDIQYLLGELIDNRYFESARAEVLSRHIHGHPATTHYAAKFINSGKNLDTLNENPEPIYAFQQRILGEILSEELLSEDQRRIIALLSVFPRLSFSILARVLEMQRKQLALDLWELQEASLISATGSEYYSSPSVVANRARKELSADTHALLNDVKLLIEDDMTANKLDSQLIDALLIASATPTGEVPAELNGLVTSSSLLTMVTDRFFRAREVQKGSRDIYLSAYSLSKLALEMETSDDAVEQILFTGGDSAIRAGVFPEQIIKKMQDAALPSVYYLQGSYAFHVLKDDESAVRNLRRSLETKHFKLRNIRLLARALIRSQDFSGALDVLGKLSDHQIERETGLMIQKIRAYRGLRSHAEADALERKIQGRNDEYGEVHIYNAGRALQEGNYDDSLAHLSEAEACPRVNRFTLQLLKCAVLLENGDASMLPLVVETANSVNRRYDAEQLQARHAVVQGRWADAEQHLSKIERKDYFDLQIAHRMLKQKMEDLQIKTNATAMKRCQDELDEVVRLSTRSPAGFRTA